jgi:hypothetical protein
MSKHLVLPLPPLPVPCLLVRSGAADVREAVIAVGLKPKEMTKQERQQFNGRTRAYLQARCVFHPTLQAADNS